MNFIRDIFSLNMEIINFTNYVDDDDDDVGVGDIQISTIVSAGLLPSPLLCWAVVTGQLRSGESCPSCPPSPL